MSQNGNGFVSSLFTVTFSSSGHLLLRLLLESPPAVLSPPALLAGATDRIAADLTTAPPVHLALARFTSSTAASGASSKGSSVSGATPASATTSKPSAALPALLPRSLRRLRSRRPWPEEEKTPVAATQQMARGRESDGGQNRTKAFAILAQGHNSHPGGSKPKLRGPKF